jgi:hypothetical protein
MLNKIIITSIAIFGLLTLGLGPIGVQAITKDAGNPAPVELPPIKVPPIAPLPVPPVPPLPPLPPLLPISNFKCGPGLDTYKAASLNTTGQVIGDGMRCVKRTIENQGRLSFAWYGEGNVANCKYRILGHAIYGGFSNSPTNTISIHKTGAADIWGNGECRMGDYNGTLLAYTDIAYNTIKITGALTEIWKKVPSLYYTPMPRISQCGNTTGLVQYKAIDGVSGAAKNGVGVRCVLKHYFPDSTWFGNGWWFVPGFTYTELGTKHPVTGYGSSTIVGGGTTGYGFFNVLRNYGTIAITWAPGTATIPPIKDEYWY